MANKIQLRRDTAANWTRVNPILDDGEAGLDTTFNSVKYGDGNTPWNDLPYAGIGTLIIDVENGITFLQDGNTSIAFGDGLVVSSQEGDILLGSSNDGDRPPDEFHIEKTSPIDLYFGGDNDYVKLPQNGGVEIGSNAGNNTWKFDLDGNITVPFNGSILSKSDSLGFVAHLTNVTINPGYPTYITVDEADINDLNSALNQTGNKLGIADIQGGLGAFTNGHQYYVQQVSPVDYELYNDPNFTQMEDLSLDSRTNGLMYNWFDDRPVTNSHVTSAPFNPFTYGSLTFSGGAKGSSPGVTAKDAAYNTTGDFTLECQFYPTEFNDGGIISIGDTTSSGNGGIDIPFSADLNSSGNLVVRIGDASSTYEMTLLGVSLNAWNHVALVRSSGQTRVFLNGIGGPGGGGFNNATGTVIRIGDGTIGSQNNFNGKITEVRFSTVARYDPMGSTISPPTTYFATDSDTQLLIQAQTLGTPFFDTSGNLREVIPYMSVFGTVTTTPSNSTGIADPSVVMDLSQWAWLINAGYIEVGDSVLITEGASAYGCLITNIQSPTSGDVRYDQFYTLDTKTSFVDGSTVRLSNSSVGQPTWSSLSPFGSLASSMSFTSTGNGATSSKLTIGPSEDFDIGTNDFSVECWFYIRNYNNSDYPRIFDVNGGTLGLSSEPDGLYAWVNSTAYLIKSGAVVSNSWYHVAITRVSGDLYMFVNGITPGGITMTDYISLSGYTLYIGCQNNDSSGFQFFNGYVRDFKFNVGASAYGTTNFSLPYQPLAKDGNYGNTNPAADRYTKVLLTNTSDPIYEDSSESFESPGLGTATSLNRTGDINIEVSDATLGGDRGAINISAGTNTLAVTENGITANGAQLQIGGQVITQLYSDIANGGYIQLNTVAGLYYFRPRGDYGDNGGDSFYFTLPDAYDYNIPAGTRMTIINDSQETLFIENMGGYWGGPLQLDSWSNGDYILIVDSEGGYFWWETNRYGW